MIERYYVNFRSAFRNETAPCISHETIDQVRTLCGRMVADAVTLEPDSNDLEPDCLSCRRALARVRQESQLKCAGCATGHRPGVLRRPCGVHGCECWCNRK